MRGPKLPSSLCAMRPVTCSRAVAMSLQEGAAAFSGAPAGDDYPYPADDEAEEGAAGDAQQRAPATPAAGTPAAAAANVAGRPPRALGVASLDSPSAPRAREGPAAATNVAGGRPPPRALGVASLDSPSAPRARVVLKGTVSALSLAASARVGGGGVGGGRHHHDDDDDARAASVGHGGDGDDDDGSHDSGGGGPRTCGWLMKQGGGEGIAGRKNWKRRWFRLQPSGALQYYDAESDKMPLVRAAPLWRVWCAGCVVAGWAAACRAFSVCMNDSRVGGALCCVVVRIVSVPPRAFSWRRHATSGVNSDGGRCRSRGAARQVPALPRGAGRTAPRVPRAPAPANARAGVGGCVWGGGGAD